MKIVPNLTYYTQRNNWGDSYSECFPTSMVMAMVNNGVEKVDPTLRKFMIDDLFAHFIELTYRSKEAKYYWDKEKDSCIKWLNKSPYFNNSSKHYVAWIEGATYEQICKEIDEGYTVVLGTYKLGGLKGGHVLTVVGYDENRNFILYDPFGDPNTNYKSKNGKGVLISSSDNSISYMGSDMYRAMFIHSDMRIKIQ